METLNNIPNVKDLWEMYEAGEFDEDDEQDLPSYWYDYLEPDSIYIEGDELVKCINIEQLINQLN